MNKKFTLIPSEYFSEETAGEMLSEVVPLEEGEPLSFISADMYGVVMAYAGEKRPEAYDMILSLFKIREYNKILFRWDSQALCLVVAQGESIVFCNCFDAADFTTAEYYLLMTLKNLQINPEASCLYFQGSVSHDDRMALYNYFKSVEELS